MNMNTCSSTSTPLKAMMACLHTLIFLISMKVVRNKNTRLISEHQFLTFWAVSYIKLFWSEACKAESKKMHMWHITMAWGREWEYLQRPTANWSCTKLCREARLSLNQKTSHREISREIEHLYGFQHMLWVASTQRWKANNHSNGKYFQDNRWAGTDQSHFLHEHQKLHLIPALVDTGVGSARVPFLHCRTLLYLEWAVDV